MACPVNCLYPIVIISVSLCRGSYSYSSLYSQHWPECRGSLYPVYAWTDAYCKAEMTVTCFISLVTFVLIMYPYGQIFIYVWKVVIRNIFSWRLLVSTENSKKPKSSTLRVSIEALVISMKGQWPPSQWQLLGLTPRAVRKRCLTLNSWIFGCWSEKHWQRTTFFQKMFCKFVKYVVDVSDPSLWRSGLYTFMCFSVNFLKGLMHIIINLESLFNVNFIRQTSENRRFFLFDPRFGSCTLNVGLYLSLCLLDIILYWDKGGRLVYFKGKYFHQCQTHEDVHGHARPNFSYVVALSLPWTRAIPAVSSPNVDRVQSH